MTEQIKIINDDSSSTLYHVKDDYQLLAEKLEVDITYHYSPELIRDEIIKRF